MASEPELTAVVGEDFRIELEARPIAGYRWRVREPLPAGLELRDSGIEAGAGIGAPARQTFDFRPTAEGEFVLVLDYGRSWGPEAHRSRTYRVRAERR